ncbi:MAG: hypothetical protein AAGJ83_09970 [Planctomycetota bacterium]
MSNEKKGIRPRPKQVVNRRLVRMGIALFLVIVVMRQSREPGLYRPFFGEVSTQSVKVAVNGGTAIERTSRSALIGELDADVARTDSWDDRDDRWLGEWVRSMETSLQQSWIEFLCGLRRGSTGVVLSPEELDASASLLEALPVAGEEIRPLRRALMQFLVAARGGESSPMVEKDGSEWEAVSQWSARVLESFRDVSIERISDSTLWVGGDSDAFNLCLLLADDLVIENSVKVGVLPLLQQPDVYFDDVVRVAGSIQLATLVSSPVNRVGVDAYWQLWIIPDDGGKRPIQVICQSLPDALKREIDTEGRWKIRRSTDRQRSSESATGRIEFVGRFLKRISYQSSIGDDLAPVIVGRVHSLETESVSKTAATRGAINPQGQPRLVIGIGVAVLLGIVVAIGIMYRSRIQQRQARLLRQKAAPDRIRLLTEAIGSESGNENP